MTETEPHKTGCRFPAAASASGFQGCHADIERFTVVPGHPVRWIRGELFGVSLELVHVIERVGPAELAGVDEAHEEIPGVGAVLA